MANIDRLVAEFGSPETTSPVRLAETGGFTFVLDGESVRSIKWRGVEVVRAIAWPIRDPNWITLAQVVHDEHLEQGDDDVRYTLRFSVDEGALDCRLEVCATSAGTLSAELEMTPKVEFATNRAGFTVLHPIDGVAGTPLELRHSDATAEATRFPQLISPDQPAMDIVGMKHNVAGVDVDLTFTGEIFEMEDQRNWTDASYKTYCVPLVYPFTYTLAAGETVRQKIDLTVAGDPKRDSADKSPGLAISPLQETIPRIALAVEDGWMCAPEQTDLVRQTGVTSLQVRTGPQHRLDFLSASGALGREMDAQVDVEIVVPGEEDPAAEIATASLMLEAGRLAPQQVLALPQAYLGSYQPSGPWPDGPTPADALAAARPLFPKARIGGGVLTNFTEFNRCRPDSGACDFISHGTTAIVHASDDMSVLETLEALPQVFASAQALGQGKPYCLGLVSIAMRSNPYGAAVADNPGQVRQTMAMFDPRQRGLFGAAFAVGAMAASEGHQVDCMALAAPSGPFGIVSETQPVSRPYFDQKPEAVVYPIYHVVREAAALQGKTRCAIENLPGGLHGVAAREASTVRLMVANLGSETAQLSLTGLSNPSRVRVLDASTFEAAVCDADWLDKPGSQTDATVKLDPFAILFATLPRSD